MRRFLWVAVLVCAVTAVIAVGASAAGGKLKCFVGSPATCTINTGTAGSATLDTTDGGYAGVYYNGSKAPGASLTSVDYSFDYTCQPSNVETVTCVGGGAPRWSIPIDSTGDGKTDGYAFIDAANCGYTGTVSTTAANCAVFYGPGSWVNWDAFAAANPTHRIGNDLPFVISDVQTANPVTLYGVSVTK